ncbi:energy transducer TonB [Alloacidobacterium dinghuense]|uniref:Energy transducer TonB n=1 Tax=Alloacidobacterium dinghuense TaxID=2763107 RepID=A0A7G8BNH7_9BACT|nr:energy transducer TonB [Alloacidobacterium dinghuense]QNI34097.1 energy transducer TonB [Alloacidobacterium dinghuense]
MFEDSLVESVGRIRTRSRYFAVGSFGVQALLLAALVMYPFLHPAVLPKQALTILLTASPVPLAPANLPQRTTAASTHSQPIMIINPLTIPSRIPQHVVMDAETGPPPAAADTGFGKAATGTDSGLFDTLGSSSPAVVKPPSAKGPVHISSGVAAGQLLVAIQPIYPAIARQARVQGTVVVQAVISTSGTIEQLHVVSGPPMLQGAAIESIRRARYRPFMLNGEPVAVETTISVVFTLGGGN